ncbi:MAG: hypothetical protein DRJ67_12540 [Thermoprotei archaeon]|nr:MAG: hypothetical protein DRJ67_12540 [Thermoprotei archaeon]
MSYPGRVVFFCVGDGARTVERFGANPWELLSDRGSQELMLALADGPRTLAELRDKVAPEALERLDILVKHGLVRQVGGAYAASIPVVTDAKARRLRVLLRPLAAAVAGVVERRVGEVKSAFMRTRLAEGFEWGDVAHILVDALLLDFSMLSCVENLLTRERLFQGWSRWQRVIPFFGMEVGPHMANFGVNSWFIDGFGISVMHGSMIRRTGLLRLMSVLQEQGEVLLELCRSGSIREVPSGLVELGLVRASGEGYELAVPVLRGGDKVLVTEAVVAVAHEAAEELVARYGVIEDAFRSLGYAEWLEGVGDFVELAIHVVMALSIEELVERGALPGIPEEPSASWGVWLWEAPWTLDYSVIYRHIFGEIREIVERHGACDRVEELISGAENLARKGEYGEALMMLKKAIDIYRTS